MKHIRFLLPLAPLYCLTAFAADAPPEKALKYHAALLKRPDNATLFDRFFGAWIDEQPVESLEKFLVSRAEKNGAQDLAVLARYQLRRGKEEDALATLGKAIAALPDDSALSMERGKILLRRLEFEAAREDFARVASGKNETLATEAAKLTGKSYLREGKPEKAIEAWDALLATRPEDEDLLEDLVESAAAENETTQALAYIDKLIATTSDPYKKTLRQLRRGDLLALSGNNDEAVKSYSATLANVGEGSWLEREVLAQIESLFRKQDRLDDLSATLRKLAEENPRRLLLHRQLAKLEAAQGEIDSAIGRFREVLKRSPGERELREEFVRLLTDSERLEDAAEELGKMIDLAPEDAALRLQMAALAHRQENKEATLAALEKAHGLLGENESDSIRIASLMLQYDLTETGEKLLKKLVAAPDATAAPSEALAAEYARTNRKPEALALLKALAAEAEIDVLLRTASSVSALGESATAFDLLSSRAAEFEAGPRFLVAITQTALAADKPEEAVARAVKLVRLSKNSADLADSIGLALRVISAADKILEWRETLAKLPEPTLPEKCLSAALAESQGDFDAVEKTMAGASDPLLLRFHAALLDRRGAFDEAIATLSRLADTDEGRKTAFFKDMTELQQRAGKTEDALATVNRWQQSSPGDKSAWISGSRLLREMGRPDEAVRMTRQAVARFEGDADLAASLATLYTEAGQPEDAEDIYWRLYDDSSSPNDQVRWATQLAQLALQTGRTEDLDEKLRERARGNRRSIGPVLAQAELARVLRNDDKRRDLLLEAVRLQPKDIDLRLQIANLEEQSGNPDRVIGILEDAVDGDPSGRIRNALAQAYLRQGQTMKGMRELRALSAKKGKDDPRSVEISAASLASAGLYEEAIRFLRESLPDGGDWRTKYLLATMLEQDGREAEALPLFLELTQATGEVMPTPKTEDPRANFLAEYSEEVRKLIGFSSNVMTAYAHRGDRNRGGYYRMPGTSTVGIFMLPDLAENARTMATVHLAKLSKAPGMDSGKVLGQLKAVGIDNAPFLFDLVNSTRDGSPDYAALFEKHTTVPGMLEIALLYGNRYGNGYDSSLDKDLLEKALAETKNLTPILRFRAATALIKDAKEDDPAWETMLTAARDSLASDDENVSRSICYQLLSMLAPRTQIDIPDARKGELKKIMLDFVATDDGDDAESSHMRLMIQAGAGTRRQAIDALNREVARHRKSPAEDPSGMAAQLRQRMAYASQYGNYNPWSNGQSPFVLPQLQHLTLPSLPSIALSTIRPENENGYGGASLKPEELIPDLATVDSPALRAWIALRADDKEAIKKALSEEPPAAEAADFDQLRAMAALGERDFPKAYELFEAARPTYASDRNLNAWLNLALIAIASEMTPEQRTEISEKLRPILIQTRQVLGVTGAPVLAAKAEELGFVELAKRFRPQIAASSSAGGSRLGPASISRSGSSSPSSAGSMDKLKKFTSTKKYEAAAREALLLIRKANASSYRNSYELRQIKEALNDEIRAELVRMVDPGESKSLTKRLEYADICAEYGKKETAMKVLTALNEERPEDPAVAARLAFLLPANQEDLALSLLTKAAATDEFVGIASAHAEDFSNSNNEDASRSIAFYNIVARWLEGSDPGKLDGTNLTWISYYGKNFFERGASRSLRSLVREQGEDAEEDKDYKPYVATAKRLSLAMMRHPSLAEQGFRLYSASKAWETPPAELDEMMRATLLALRIDSSPQRGRNHIYTLVRSNGGGSSSGDDLPSHSSGKLLAERLAGSDSPDQILPPAYLKELNETNPEVGKLVSAIATLDSKEKVSGLWESGLLEKGEDGVSTMLREAFLSRAATIPGSSAYFLNLVREIDSEKLLQELNRGQGTAEIGLLGAALRSVGPAADPDALDEVAEAVSAAVFGKEINWDIAKDEGMNFYRGVGAMAKILETLQSDDGSSLRYVPAFHRLGTPLGQNEYYVTSFLENKQLATPEEAEKFLDSIGFLEDLPAWRPLVATIANMDQINGVMTAAKKEILLNESIYQRINTSFSRSDLVKRLRERKPRTFGNLITAATISNGGEREKLTAEAFALAAPRLAELRPNGSPASACSCRGSLRMPSPNSPLPSGKKPGKPTRNASPNSPRKSTNS